MLKHRLLAITRRSLKLLPFNIRYYSIIFPRCQSVITSRIVEFDSDYIEFAERFGKGAAKVSVHIFLIDFLLLKVNRNSASVAD